MELLGVTKDSKKVYRNHRDEPYFTYVKEGVKTIEGRLAKGLYVEVRSGDYIEIHNRDDYDEYFFVEVLRADRYMSFLDMLTREEFKKVLPDVASPEDGVIVYRQFYSEEKELELGVVALTVKVVDDIPIF